MDTEIGTIRTQFLNCNGLIDGSAAERFCD
jgi:hypothetical protein